MRYIFSLLSILLQGGIVLVSIHPLKGEEGAIKDAEFIIEKTRKNHLSHEDRLFENAPIIPLLRGTGATGIGNIQESEPKFDVIENDSKLICVRNNVLKYIYENYIQGGFSTLLLPYIKGFLCTKEHKKYEYGLKFCCLPTRRVDHARSIITQLYGKLFVVNWVLYSKAGYHYDAYSLYDKKGNKVNQKEILHCVTGEIEVSNCNRDYKQYQLNTYYNLIKYADKKLLEHLGSLYCKVRYCVQDWLNFKATTNLYITHIANSDKVQHRNLIIIKPSVIAKNGQLQLKLGGTGAYQTDKKLAKKLNIYPAVKLSCALYQTFNVYLGIGGTIQPIFLYTLSNENALLVNNVELQHVDQKCRMYGGIKGALTTNTTFHIGASWQQLNNTYRFIRTDHKYTEFDVKYNPNSINGINVMTILSYANTLNTFNLNIRGDCYHVLEKELPTWWYKDPCYKVSLEGVYKLYNKFLFKPICYWLARVVAKEEAGSNKNLPDIIDLGLGIDYQYTPKFSIFINIENLLDRKNERYINYFSKGFCFTAGMMYSW